MPNSPSSAICIPWPERSEEHTSEFQSQSNLVCRLLLEKKKKHRRIQLLHQCGNDTHHVALDRIDPVALVPVRECDDLRGADIIATVVLLRRPVTDELNV